MFIIFQGLSFGGFSLKIELVVFVYELIIYSQKNYFLWLGYVIISLSIGKGGTKGSKPVQGVSLTSYNDEYLV